MNLKKIKDSKFDKLRKLFGFLTEKEQVQDSAEYCDDIIVAQQTGNVSDEDVIHLWDEYANSSKDPKATQRDFQEFLAEQLDQPESLDDSTYDYCVHQGIHFEDAVYYLNNYLGVNDKVMLCSKIIEHNLI